MYYVGSELTGVIVMTTRFKWRAQRRINRAVFHFKSGTVDLRPLLAIYKD